MNFANLKELISYFCSKVIAFIVPIGKKIEHEAEHLVDKYIDEEHKKKFKDNLESGKQQLEEGIAMFLGNLEDPEDETGSPVYRAINARPNRAIMLLFKSLIIFLVIFIFWASFFKVDGFIHASGKVETFNQLNIIYARGGEVIKEILVNEGDHVTKDQPLVTFDSEAIKTRVDSLQERYYLTLANITWKEAILENKPLQIPEEVKNFSESMTNHIQQSYENRQKNIQDGVSIYDQQIRQKQIQLQKLFDDKDSLDARVKIAQEQVDLLSGLEKKELVSKIRLLENQKDLNESQQKLQSVISEIPKTESEIQEAKDRRDELISSNIKEIRADIDNDQSDFANIEASLAEAKDLLKNTAIAAPIDGIIYSIPNTTVTSAIQSNREVISLVPIETNLIVKAMVPPESIGFVHVDQPVRIKINTFDYTIYGELDGKIISISPETQVNEADKKAYFEVKVETTSNYLEYKGKRFYIMPGMSSMADIKVDSRTIMQYLVNPFIKTLKQSLTQY